MRIRKCALSVGISLIVLAWQCNLAAQEAGSEHQGSLPLYDSQNRNIVYEIPLPQGKWLVRNVTNRDSGESKLKDVRLGLIENGKLMHTMEITAKVGGDSRGRWTDEPCKVEPVLYKNNYDTALWSQKCMTLQPQTFLQNNNESTRQFLKILADGNVKHDYNSLGSTYTRYGDLGKFLIVKLNTFPSNYGLDNPAIGALNTSPYHPSRVGTNKEIKEFVENLAKYSENLTRWYDLAYEGKKFDQLARFKHPVGQDSVGGELQNRLSLLEQSLQAKLITQAEFDQKRSELLRGKSQQ